MKTINGITFCDDYDEYEISEEDIEILKIRFYFAMEERNIYGIWHHHYKNESDKAEQCLEKMLPLMDYEYTDEGKADAQKLIRWFKSHTDHMIYPHGGDCTKDAYSCCRCFIEGLMGISTRHKIIKGQH